MTVPNGFAEIIKAYGDPREFLGPDGSMDAKELAAWEMHLGLLWLPFPAPLQLAWGKPGQMALGLRCHPAAYDSFRSALRTIHSENLWPLLKTFGGCFAVRQQRGSADKWSTHSWGISADVNVLNNPLGGPSNMDLGIVRIFESCGFKWGGDWRRPDPMHYQLCTGY